MGRVAACPIAGLQRSAAIAELCAGFARRWIERRATAEAGRRSGVVDLLRSTPARSLVDRLARETALDELAEKARVDPVTAWRCPRGQAPIW
jgi:hypothetical protein